MNTNKYLTILLLIISTLSYSQAPLPFNYAFEIDDAGFNTTYDITTDPLGNVFVTGSCSAAADMDPSNATVLAGNSGFFVAKYSPTGSYLWHRMFTSPSGSFGYGLTARVRVTQNNDLILAGYYNGTIDFDPGVGTDIHESVLFVAGPDPDCDPEIEECCDPEDGDCNAVHTDDIFVLSLDASGDFNWVNTYGGFGRDEIEKIDIDSNNDIIAVGNYENDIDIGPDSYSSFGVSSSLYIKFDILGSIVSSFDLPTKGRVLAVTCDDLGNFYVSTRFNFTVDFDPGFGTASETSFGSNDVAIVKFNSSMAFQWVKVFAGFQLKSVYDLSIDPFGDLVGIGTFSGSMDIDPGVVVNNIFSVGLSDTFIFKMTPAGNVTWVKALQGVNNCLGIALTTNSIGDVFGLGYFEFTVDFNPGLPNYPIVSNGENDIFQVTLDKNGIFKGAFSYGGTLDDYGTAITSDPFDRIISAGWYENASVDFNPTAAGTTLLTTTSNAAIFVQSLGASNGSCPDNLTLGNINDSADYYASDYIIGEGPITTAAVKFQAVNYVLLNPGFSTGSTTVFRAELGACP